MKWLFSKEYLPKNGNGITGRRFNFLTIFHIAALISTKKGKHITINFGIGSFEIGMQFSYWMKDNLIIWDGANVGKS